MIRQAPKPTTEYTVRLRPLADGGDPEGTRRLRAFLKTALRSFRLRCTGVKRDGKATEDVVQDVVDASTG